MEEKMIEDFRVIITQDVQYFNEKTFYGFLLARRFRDPMTDTKENGILRYKPKEGVIQKGITGRIIKKWGMKYFAPDVDQAGIELFTPSEQPYILVPYRKIKNHYKEDTKGMDNR